ncbi:MAG: type II secretion system protein [Lachnospiraceae bacterium]|nr:type II secretion system protein [Lachnospiraceae bacterium]
MRKFVKKLKRVFKERANDNKGFTFVELLCASVILALIVAPALQLFLFATKANSKARTELQAEITASSVLESARSFSIYNYDIKCNSEYTTDDEKDTFTLLAGAFVKDDETGNQEIKTLMHIDNTSCYEIEFKTDDINDPDYYVIKDIKKNSAGIDSKGNVDGPYVEHIDKDTGLEIYPDRLQLASGERCRYAYAINGIKQSQNTYDAVIMFEKFNYQTLTINNESFTEENVSKTLSKYNKNYKITVFLYRSKDFGTKKSYFISKGNADNANLNDKNRSLIMVIGSKLDSAKTPGEMGVTAKQNEE